MICYSELIQLETFEERYSYLKLDGIVGFETFGFDRYLNQLLYKSKEWNRCRTEIIVRDNGCDLGVDDYVIYGKILIHHMTPITKDDIVNNRPILFDHDKLISTSFETHNAIHYGESNALLKQPIERTKHDTAPWLL